MDDELRALRSTNESLSSQLVELTTGNALKRAEEREAQLTEYLEQRFISKTEEIRAELNTTQRHLTQKVRNVKFPLFYNQYHCKINHISVCR